VSDRERNRGDRETNIGSGNDIDIDGGDWNIDVDGGCCGGWGGGWYGGGFWAGAALGAITMGAWYSTLPAGCPMVYTYATPYYHCGGYYYAPQMQGDEVVYVVVDPEAEGTTVEVQH
jgi:hypothetical protein